MIAIADLIEKFRYALNNDFGYIYGTAGVMWTQARQDALQAKTNSNYDVSKKYGAKWIGHYVADCSGLFAWAFRQLGGAIAHGSNSIWRGYLSEKGKIQGKTLVPGTAVFKLKDKSNYYHIGLYIGGDTVIEAKGTIAGVVTSKISTWTHYGLLKGVDYMNTSPKQEDLQPGAAVVDVPNDGTVRVRARPSTSGQVLTTLREGETVQIESIEGDWAKVTYTGSGYIMKEFLREKD